MSTPKPSGSSTPFRLLGKKRALLIAVRSVTAPEYSDLPHLTFAHRDARELCDRLINHNGYQAEDVILMLDDKHHPKDLWPTHHKILRQIDQLTHDVPEDCHFFFYFSGHGLEQKCCGRANLRADGQDEEIVSADGKLILDYILHNRLLMPLEKVKGSKLFALLDCCHSESLLDLQMGKTPNKYSREWNIGRDQLFKVLSISILGLLQLNKRNRKCGQISRRKSTYWLSESTPEACQIGNLSVVCLSACRDRQLAHDDRERQLTFTRCFLNATAEKPNITWTELRDVLKDVVYDIRTRYPDVYWMQEPRISTNSSTDLTQPVTEMI